MKRAALFFVLSLAACSGAPSIAPVDERNDVERLQNVMTEDPAQLVLAEIDHAIAADRPVMAADIIEHSAIPAVRRHIIAVEASEVRTSNGRALRTRAVRLLRHRMAALEHWRDALARGIGQEDEALLSAIHENAEAEHEISDFLRELATIRPLDTRAPSVTGDHLEGLPDLAPPAAPSDDDPESPPPEPDPHAAEPIDGREELDEPELPQSPADPDDHHAIVPSH